MRALVFPDRHVPVSVPTLDSEDSRSRVASGESIWQQDRVWRGQVEALRNLPAGLRVMELCGGLSSGYLALKSLLGSEKVTLAGYWDSDSGLRPGVESTHGSDPNVHLGSDGNLLNWPDVEQFPDCEVVVAGPPCPPWSDMGVGQSFDDPRSDVFWKVVDIVAWLGQRDELLVFAIENVKGVMKKNRAALKLHLQ